MNEVKRYVSTRLLPDASTWNVSGAAHTYVHISDYAALEAECERLRKEKSARQALSIQLIDEARALRAQLATLKGQEPAASEGGEV